MRKIERDMNNAISNFKPWSDGNTCFTRQIGNPDGWQLSLHGNVIALFDAGAERPSIPTAISLAGWNTPVTRSRLNALDGINITVKKGVPYLNGTEIDDEGFFPVFHR